MIIGRAIGRLLDGETFKANNSECSEIAIKYNYGNQDALDKFIAQSNKVQATKYPLVFYVINSVKDLDGWKYCNTDLIIMMNTKEELLYKNRTDKTYIPYIEPLYNKLKTLLIKEPYFQILESSKLDRLSYSDVPNFGIVKGSVGNNKSKESVVTDYVDARVIKINFRIKTNCIK